MSTSFTEVYDINSQHSIEIQSITHIAESFKQNYQKFWAMTFVVTAIYGTEKILCSNNQIKATFLVAFHVNIKTNILTSSKMTIWSEITGIINAPMPPKLGNTVQSVINITSESVVLQPDEENQKITSWWISIHSIQLLKP